MKIIVAAIGRAKAGPERELFQSYLARLPWTIELKEIEIKKELDTSTRRAREGYALLNSCPPQARIVALDERGKAETSATFATRIGRWRDGGARAIVFLIGGADGLDDNIRSRADAILSFGSMTWPHMLVRPLLAEQLYRAHSILSGHPYHRA
jgi:23S rRNA (pseudouridine1915-N3)-methyltransferase